MASDSRAAESPLRRPIPPEQHKVPRIKLQFKRRTVTQRSTHAPGEPERHAPAQRLASAFGRRHPRQLGYTINERIAWQERRCRSQCSITSSKTSGRRGKGRLFDRNPNKLTTPIHHYTYAVSMHRHAAHLPIPDHERSTSRAAHH